MSGKSVAEANTVLAAVSASTRYLALLTTVPTAADTGSTIVEAGYTGYARKAVLAADWAAPASGAMYSANALAFAACTGGTSTVVAWALCDNASTGAGAVKYWGTCSIAVSNGVTPTVPAGQLGLVEVAP